MKGVLCRCGLLIGLSLVSSCAFAQLTGKKYALVVGIDRYPHWDNLTYAVNDARGMAELFEEMGFEVKTLYNGKATKASIIGWMEDKLAPILTNSDMVVFFFAGHGETRYLGGRDWGYIVPVDGTQEAGSLIARTTGELFQSSFGLVAPRPRVGRCLGYTTFVHGPTHPGAG
ncbi:MAG: caspase family protein [Acidobacteriota bacterium]|nr:caspase family protein [Acidobacteriota bacterium]